ncbi:hypothetical protein IV102_05000 [bacterium]|nr:hypothetical protein [bacterium]
MLKLKRERAIVVGGNFLRDRMVRFSLPKQEMLILRQFDDGQFEVRALIEGLSLNS